MPSPPSIARLAFWSLALFLLAVPLTLVKPGLPAGLKADEAAYYMMASSLAADGDLRLDVADTERVFEEFPYRPVNNLIVMSADGWKTAHYGKPMVYSLFAAPFVGLFGANGMLFFNMLLTVAMIALGARFLRRYNSEATALLFSCGFFLASAGFAYTFWLQPEVFNMFAVTLALYLGWPRATSSPEETDEEPRTHASDVESTGKRSLVRLLLAGGVLALAAFSKPMILALALPLVAAAWIQRPTLKGRLFAAGALAVGLVGVLGGLALLNTLWTGRPTPYLGVARQGITLCEPGVLPASVLPKEPTPAHPSAGSPADEMADEMSSVEPPPGSARTGSATGNAFSWLLRLPELRLAKLTEDVRYFLWGRHTGLLLYFPFCALALALFLLHTRRSLVRWLLLASLVAVAGYFLIWIDWNWQGGGGFVGNRYFVNVVPAFLFLVGPIRPRWTVPAAFAAAGLLIGTVVLTPFSNVVPEPTLQAHTRNWPLRLFPLELTLRNVPGYYKLEEGTLRAVVRRDRAVPRGDALWLSGGASTELLLLASEPIHDLQLLVRSPAGGRLSLRAPGIEEILDLRAGELEKVTLELGRPKRQRSASNGVWFVYRLVVDAPHGALETWRRGLPPQACTAWNSDPSIAETFYVGAELILLGPSAQLDQDLYRARWGSFELPATVPAGSTFEVRTPVRNASNVDWPSSGGASVKLGYRWRDATGSVVGGTGARNLLLHDLPAGQGTGVLQTFRAPEQPGVYTLELDPVYEHVSWFGDRDPQSIYRAQVEVVEDATPAGEPAHVEDDTN